MQDLTKSVKGVRESVQDVIDSMNSIVQGVKESVQDVTNRVKNSQQRYCPHRQHERE